MSGASCITSAFAGSYVIRLTRCDPRRFAHEARTHAGLFASAGDEYFADW
jgi:hypothetical protein